MDHRGFNQSTESTLARIVVKRRSSAAISGTPHHFFWDKHEIPSGKLTKLWKDPPFYSDLIVI